MNTGETASAPFDSPTLGARVLTTLTRKRLPNLFPPNAAEPLALLWVWLLPQALLLFLNWRAWDLISGEVHDSGRTIALTVFGMQIVLWLGGAALLAALQLRKKTIPRLAGGALLISSAIYLAFVLLKAGDAIPASVQQWMLPSEQWMFNQFALVGAGALYGAFRLLCPDRESDFASGGFVTIIALASPFALILLVMGTAMSGAILHIGWEYLQFLFVPLYLAASMLAVGGVLRICISAYVAARSSSPKALAMLTFVIALALPLGGLALNFKIPFPADFQSPAIYILAILNGIVLTLPNFSHPSLRRAILLAQCATFPFTVYFFAVFLPVLPLMPLAAICLAAGLLTCVPSALFLLHGCRILDGLRTEIRLGSRWLAPALAIGAVALGPVLITAKILRDRVTLTAALDYLQYPDYSRPATFTGHRPDLRSALLSLRDFKEGRYLPFYSEFYNWLAFDNLLLPDQKIADTWRTFFGDEMPKPDPNRMDIPFLRGERGAGNREILGSTEGPRPPAGAITQSLRTTATAAPGEVRATAMLGVTNPTGRTTEYRALVHLPAGVWITGMRLTIGTERVPARLFEERTALWVYNKITEVRAVPRDPAILRYVGPETAELRVYPVEPRAARFVEIDFTYPDNLSPSITIDDRRLDLPPAAQTTALVSGTTAWVPPSAVAAIAPIRRIPQPQLLVDVSKSSLFRDSPAALRDAIRKALDAFPAAKTARILFANFDTRDFRDGAAIPVEELRNIDPALILGEAGAFEGGFREAFAIKSALARRQSADPESVLREFPAAVALRGAKAAAVATGADQLAPFARYAPDQPAWWSLDPADNAPKIHPLDPEAPPAGAIASVHVFKVGEGRFAVAADRTGLLVSWNKESPNALAVFDPAKNSFVPVPAATNAGTNVAAGASVWALALQRIYQPSAAGGESLAALVDIARKTGVLVPSTALMVVENTAQWKMLDRTEQKTLKAHEALALTETSNTPEPGVIVLLILAGAALLIRQRLAKMGRERSRVPALNR